MKTKRFILSLISVVLSLNAFAWDIRIGNAYYNIISETDQTVALTYGEMPYSGDFTVPETINYGKTYKVVEISGTAFYKSPNLRSLVIGNNITSMPMRLSDKCPVLKKVTLNCNEYLKNANTPSKSLNLVFGDQVEEYVFGNDVEKIGNFLFFKCSKVKKVTLGNSIKSIGEEAFSECSNLETINIPSTIQSISTIAFEYCTSLKSVSIDSQTFLNQKFNAQFSCKDYFGTQVEKYTIGNNVTSIANYAFAGCSNLKSVSIDCPEIVAQTFTPNRTFSSIFGAQVEEYIIGNNVTKIGDYAFCNCVNMKLTTLGKNIQEIGKKAYYNCNNVANINLSDKVTMIGDSAFYNCALIPEVKIAATVTKIGKDAFALCNNLSKVTHGNVMSMCMIDYANLAANPMSMGKHLYFNGSNAEVTEIVVPSSIDHIKDFSFVGCSSVASITFPNSITSIGEYACYECSSIESITIPDNVESIGKFAFNHCSNLRGVRIGTGLKTLGESTFVATSLEGIRVEAAVPPVCEGDIVSTAAYSYVYLETLNDSYATAHIWEKFLDFHPTAVEKINTNATDVVPVAYYDLNGIQYAEPQQGINIVRYSDGTVKKISVK